MEIIKIKDEFIKLGQALKLSGAVSSGVEAKSEIEEGKIVINGETETRRGKKLYVGDSFEYESKTYKIEKK